MTKYYIDRGDKKICNLLDNIMVEGVCRLGSDTSA